MNKKLSISYLILVITAFFLSCRTPVKEEDKHKTSGSSISLHVGNEKYMAIATKESVVTWKGSSLMGSNSHTVFVYLSQGELKVENGQLTGGTIEVDMNTIEDKNHGRDNGLIKHLKDPDFFDVKKFPFSKVVITKVASNGEHNQITANLTIKGITQPVTFPAKLEIKNGRVNANGKLVIDRAKWDVRYKSRKFYDLLANQAISDSIEFAMKIVATK